MATIPEDVKVVLEALKSAIPGLKYGIDEEGVLVIKIDDAGSLMIEAVREKTDIPWLEEILRNIKIVRLRSRAPGRA